MQYSKLVIILFFASVLLFAEEKKENIQTIVLEEQTIKGKLKKPQAAVISLGKRPKFEPIALSMPGTSKGIVNKIDKSILSKEIYSQPFMVNENN